MPGVPEAGLRQHWSIYRAIRENNPDKARQAMRLHLAAAERNAHILEREEQAASPPPTTVATSAQKNNNNVESA